MASSIKFSGRLYNERHTFQVAAQRLNQKAKEATLKVAELYRDSLWEMLELGNQIWTIPDTPYYRKKKARFQQRHGLQETGPWIKTGELVNTISVEVSQSGDKRFRAWAGFKNGYHYSGLEVSQLVSMLDDNFPLIGPAWEKIRYQAYDIMREIGDGVFR